MLVLRSPVAKKKREKKRKEERKEKARDREKIDRSFFSRMDEDLACFNQHNGRQRHEDEITKMQTKECPSVSGITRAVSMSWSIY